jgi:hypothetical protein
MCWNFFESRRARALSANCEPEMGTTQRSQWRRKFNAATLQPYVILVVMLAEILI